MKIIKESFNILDGKKKQGRRLKFWDGKTSEDVPLIVEI